jgi:short-subunit dehydrogenase involved in D-alanine esterification of teichoic acids
MKCALITGGSRGIGSAICKKLAVDTDYHILINYQSNREAAEQTCAEVIALGATAETIQFNVAVFEDVKSALTKWQETNPDSLVEVIVNNAGITRDGLFMWMSPEDWNNVVNTSLNGFFNVTIRVNGISCGLGNFRDKNEAIKKHKEAFSLLESKQDISHLIKKKTNKTKFKGVYVSNNRFTSQIRHNGLTRSLGSYSTLKEASSVYQLAYSLKKENKSIEHLLKKRKNRQL